jgi:hypothetical protein
MMLSPVIEQVSDKERAILVPEKVSRLLSLPMDRLADLAHVHRNTLSRAPEGPQVQSGLSDIVRVLTAATSLMEGPSAMGRAVLWFRNQPIPAFGGKTALELVREGRTPALLEHLEMLEDGVYA